MWLQALDQQSVLAIDSARALYRRSIAADPTYFPAHLDYLRFEARLGSTFALRDRYRRWTTLPADVRDCHLLVLKQHDYPSPDWLDLFRAMRRRHGATPCVSFGIVMALVALPPDARVSPDEELAAARVVANAFPEHYASQEPLLASLERHGRRREARDRARRGRAGAHSLDAMHWYEKIASLALVEHDTAAARAALRDGEALATSDGRPYVRLYSVSILENVAARLGRGPTEDRRKFLRLTRDSGVRRLIVSAALVQAGPLVDAGRFQEALALIQRHTAYAKENDLVEFLMRLSLLEGRALVRSGRAREAIPALHRGLEAATRLGHLVHVAGAHHQLAHAHEELGEWPSAARSAAAFVAVAERTHIREMHVISYHDAAAIAWKAGWHAASDSLSRSMVSVIEREGTNYAYAAEYYERVGDLGRSATYLHRALQPKPGGEVADSNVVYAALTRLHLALGRPDSALATASVHDASPLAHSERLVPQVLAVMGRGTEAVVMMRAWSRLQVDRANVGGRAMALVALAEALLPQSPAEALEMATEAEAFSRAHNQTLERIAAARLRGEASARLGRPDAIPLLRAARALARAHPNALQSTLAELALGDALCDDGQHAAALDRYAAAVALVERSGRTISGDVDAARFRAARARAFDGALRSVLRRGGSADELLRWSARKKRPGDGVISGSVGVRALRSRLLPREALVDYLVVDSTVWAVVVTRGVATVLKLPATAAEIERIARRVLQPLTMTFGGRLDLARAPFDTAAAERLHDVLLRPLYPWLATASHLIIVPDAPLHSVPFDALVSARPGPGLEFVLDRWSTRYAPAPVASYRARLAMTRARVLLVAGHAPGAAEETRLVAKSWSHVDVLDGDAASESTIVERARAYPILHIASHARSAVRDPLASHLTLAPGNGGDGLLHYSEIIAARFTNALVVLNACETSAGELLAGSGFMSLARAFLVSGSGAVIATRWPVGATSGSLVSSFYEHVRAGAPVHEALRRARTGIRADPRTAHPFYWASHVMIQPF